MPCRPKIKSILLVIFFALSTGILCGQDFNGSADDRESLDKATAAIRDAFAKGDAALATSLHSARIEKYFGGNNVVKGREALEKQLSEWFRTTKVEFVENKIESTVFNGETAIQTVVFAIKTTAKDGSRPVIGRGRSIVVYVRDKSSPTGWLSLREMAQSAPEIKNSK